MFSDLWIFTQFERVAITLRDSKNKSLCVRKNMQFHGKITKSKLILCFLSLIFLVGFSIKITYLNPLYM